MQCRAVLCATLCVLLPGAQSLSELIPVCMIFWLCNFLLPGLLFSAGNLRFLRTLPSKHRLLSGTPLAAPIRVDLSLSSIMSHFHHPLVPWRCAQVDIKSLSRSLAPRHGLVRVHEQHRVESLRGHGEAATMRPSGFKLCKHIAVCLALACSVLFLFTISQSHGCSGCSPHFRSDRH